MDLLGMGRSSLKSSEKHSKPEPLFTHKQSMTVAQRVAKAYVEAIKPSPNYRASDCCDELMKKFYSLKEENFKTKILKQAGLKTIALVEKTPRIT